MLDLFDITIIGGGPSGLFASFYAGMRQAKTKIIESLDVLGGQPQLLYPEKKIYDIAGFPSVTGAELSQRLIEQALRFQPTLCLGEEALSFEKDENGHFLITSNKGQHRSKSIIIAAGAGAFQARKLNITGSSDYEGSCLHYAVKDLNSYQGQDIVIFGGGDAAVDWALALEDIAHSVTLCHRRDRFRALDYSVEQLKASSVRILTPYEPHQLIGDGKQLEAIQVKKRRKEDFQTLKADSCIVSYGFQSNLGPLKDWPLKMDRKGIWVNEQMESSQKGIFAIGDICHHPGKVDLIATGFGEAPIAVNHALHQIHPDLTIQPPQSTSLS